MLNSNTYLDKPCDRCGSKRRVLKTWEETEPTLSGKVIVITHSQIACTNQACQDGFDSRLQEESLKRDAVKQKKLENDTARKASALLQAKKTRDTLLEKHT